MMKVWMLLLALSLSYNVAAGPEPAGETFYQASIEGTLMLLDDGSVSTVHIRTELSADLSLAVQRAIESWKSDAPSTGHRQAPTAMQFSALARAHVHEDTLSSVQLIAMSLTLAAPGNTTHVPVPKIRFLEIPRFPIQAVRRDIGGGAVALIRFSAKGRVEDIWLSELFVTPGQETGVSDAFVRDAIKSIRDAAKAWRLDQGNDSRLIRLPIEFVRPSQNAKAWQVYERVEIPDTARAIDTPEELETIDVASIKVQVNGGRRK